LGVTVCDVVTAADRESEVSRKFALLAPVLDERQRRLWLAVEAREAGRGGVTMVARATGAARSTVTRGVDELDKGTTDSGRVRRPGAGRKRAEAVDPELATALERLVDPDTRGDPESPLRWTIKSTRQLSAALVGQGHRCSEWLVRRLLHEAGYSLQAAAKQVAGARHRTATRSSVTSTTECASIIPPASR
jgi:transposase